MKKLNIKKRDKENNDTANISTRAEAQKNLFSSHSCRLLPKQNDTQDDSISQNESSYMDSPIHSKRALNSRINISNSMIKDKSCLLNNTSISNSEANNQSMMSHENQIMSSYDSTVSKMKLHMGEKAMQSWERKFVNINTLLKEKTKRRTLSRLYME